VNNTSLRTTKSHLKNVSVSECVKKPFLGTRKKVNLPSENRAQNDHYRGGTNYALQKPPSTGHLPILEFFEKKFTIEMSHGLFFKQYRLINYR
jgi:hypothetical protein